MNNLVLHNQLKRRVAMTIAMLMTIIYLSYRGIATLNFETNYAIAASLMLYIAEWYGGLLMFLFFLQIWDLQNPPQMPVLPGRSVDVLIPTYNEDTQLLRGTISASLAITYPHRTYVLDDGRREEVKDLCEELGADYITRPTNLHAKAGNLNHALEMTTGELVIVFDADHVAEPSFIDRVIGYFSDEGLGFVQTPHAFYNFDAYQGVLNYERGVYWEEGMLFYNVTQPGKNRWNAVTFCGSAAMFRRKALEDVGLIATQSITEDMHTGLRMHAKGWRSLFVNERLISAMAAEDITSYNTQRLRWGEGNLGIFAFDNPLTIKGLTLAQRLCYLGSMLSWTAGVQKLTIYLTPMLMLLTDVSPVNRMTWPLIVITTVYLATVWTGVKVACNGYGWLWAIEMTQMASFWTQIRSTWRALFRRRKATFVVTSKRGRPSVSVLRQLTPQVLYIVGSTIAIGWALMRYCLRLSDNLIELSVGSLLLIVNSYLAWIVIQRAMRSKTRRSSWRHPVALQVDYRGANADGTGFCGHAVTRDINESGVSLVTFDPLPDAGNIELTITAANRSVVCRGLVRSSAKIAQEFSTAAGSTRAYVYGVQFVELTKEQLDTIWWIGAQYAVGLHYERFTGGQFGLGTMTARKLQAEKDELPFDLPFTLGVDGGSTAIAGVTEKIGPQTIVALLPKGVPAGTLCPLELTTPFGRITSLVEVVDVKSRSIAGSVVDEARLSYRKFANESRSTLQTLLAEHGSKELATVIRCRPQERPVESLRAAALIMGTSGVAAAAVVVGAFLLQQDERALARAWSGREMNEGQIAHLEHLMTHVLATSKLDEPLALRLRSVMTRLHKDDDVATIDDTFTKRSPHTFDGLRLKANNLQKLNRGEDADAIYVELLKRLDESHDQLSRSEVLLSAARNAANLTNYKDSLARYEALRAIEPLSDAARLEYEGILFHDGQGEQAIREIEAGPRSAGELHLLAAIYSSKKQFDKAIAVYQGLLEFNPEDQRAERGIADCLYWSHSFADATREYRKLLARVPDDKAVQELLAQTLMASKQYPEAVRIYTRLVDQEPQRTELWDTFLMAAAGDTALDPAARQTLKRIYRERDRRKDDNFLIYLLDAVAKHNKPSDALPLLESLSKRAPQNASLRLRWADALYNMGRYKEADVQYGWLLDHTASHAPLQPLPKNARDTTP